MRIPVWARYSLVAAVGIGLFLSRGAWLVAAPGDYVIAQKPLYMGEQVPPLMMMVMSRDERLFTKAYSDYTDLDGDGLLDTTYNDEFPYAGYFSSALCYTYSGGVFAAASEAGGQNGHSCSNQWSGNFLNWATMSRLDLLRHTLYGGLRSTDSVSETVLERAHIPNDLHAWVKVYSGSDISNFVPGATGAYSFCNASLSVNGSPLLRYANGQWPEWASTAGHQCMTRADQESVGQGSNNDAPPGTSITDLNVRVRVCQAGTAPQEEICESYGSGYSKPTGLLHTYGESGRLRFGLLTGSYGKPRSGGVLRRNIGRWSGNGGGVCEAGDEINVENGRFCYKDQAVVSEGIVATVDRFKLDQWDLSRRFWSDCDNWGIVNRQNQAGTTGHLSNPGSSGGYGCSGWGNPIAEMYAEALRYVSGQSAPTANYIGTTDLAGLPRNVSWRDPYGPDSGNTYCADCSILLLASSLPSFDSDEIPNGMADVIGETADSATTRIGQHEGINGANHVVGRVVAGNSPAELAVGNAVATHTDICETRTVGSLARVRGVCPDIPSMEGSYLVAGMAFGAATQDVRTAAIPGRPSGYQNRVRTYAVALADNLPKFSIPVAGGAITFSPTCQSNSSAAATRASAGWGSCFMGAVSIGEKNGTGGRFGRPLRDDGLAGSFSFVWEDSLWGSDFDNDVVSMITYCVGNTCDRDEDGRAGRDICHDVAGACPTIGSNEVLIRVENLAAYAGYALLTGLNVVGSNEDGLKPATLRRGNSNGSLLTGLTTRPTNWERPVIYRLQLGNSAVDRLEGPLWYAAKYGGFNDLNGNGLPDPGEWDTREAGQPDNYFFARDPSKLKEELERIFESAAAGGGETGGGGAGARINTGSFTLSTSFNVPAETTDWTGNLIARRVNEDGSEGAVLWNAANRLPAAADRKIFVTVVPTQHNANGSVASSVTADEFEYANLGTSDVERNAALGIPGTLPGWFVGRSGADLVAYIRGNGQYEGSAFRTRSSRLGDIINSDPEIVTARDDFGYGLWETSQDAIWSSLGASYKQYLEDKDGNDPVVYVGANDGMLHAFDGAEIGGGNELFAFIPANSRGKLLQLANPDYDHSYYVDGAVRVSDVATPTGNWRTVLVGAAGAGGATVFGLNVTNPGSFSDDDVLWELDGGNEQHLGHVLGTPVIAAVNIGGVARWIALFGNGVNSESGRPTLYAVDAWSGEIVARLQPTASDYALSNGLMNIAPVALGNALGLVDTVYGGDLQGNVWKFDLSSDDVSDWSVSFGGLPLFTAERAGTPQPITGGIEVSRGPGGGVSLFFGTGRYFAEGDNDTSEIQSLYSIWDNCQFATSCITRIEGGRNELVGQQITTGTTSTGIATRNVTRNFVSYALSRGWYVDLIVDSAISGERMIGTPTLQSGRVFFTTYVPTSRVCSAGGGVNWLYGLNMLTGGGAMSGVTLTPGPDGEEACEGASCGGIALNNPNDSTDTAPPTRVTNIFIPPTGTCDPSDPDCTIDKQLELSQCTFVLRATGADPLFMPRPCGRQSWRQVR